MTRSVQHCTMPVEQGFKKTTCQAEQFCSRFGIDFSEFGENIVKFMSTLFIRDDPKRSVPAASSSPGLPGLFKCHVNKSSR